MTSKQAKKFLKNMPPDEKAEILFDYASYMGDEYGEYLSCLGQLQRFEDYAFDFSSISAETDKNIVNLLTNFEKGEEKQSETKTITKYYLIDKMTGDKMEKYNRESW